MKHITCHIGEEEFALSIESVLSIERLPKIRKLPQTEDYIAGIMELRNSVIPVMDLRVWLGHPQTITTEQTRIIVSEFNDKKLGLIVDAATDVIDINSDSIETVETKRGTQNINKVANLDGRLILMLQVGEMTDLLTVQQN